MRRIIPTSPLKVQFPVIFPYILVVAWNDYLVTRSQNLDPLRIRIHISNQPISRFFSLSFPTPSMPLYYSLALALLLLLLHPNNVRLKDARVLFLCDPLNRCVFSRGIIPPLHLGAPCIPDVAAFTAYNCSGDAAHRPAQLFGDKYPSHQHCYRCQGTKVPNTWRITYPCIMIAYSRLQYTICFIGDRDTSKWEIIKRDSIF